MDAFFRNARARHTRVEATLHHSCAAQVRNREVAPADLVVLGVAQTAGDGEYTDVCYVETKSLDGDSDYAIAQFAFLQRLLLVHGRWNYRRTSKLVCHIFYKNVLQAMLTFWYASLNQMSGTKNVVEYAASTVFAASSRAGRARDVERRFALGRRPRVSAHGSTSDRPSARGDARPGARARSAPAAERRRAARAGLLHRVARDPARHVRPGRVRGDGAREPGALPRGAPRRVLHAAHLRVVGRNAARDAKLFHATSETRGLARARPLVFAVSKEPAERRRSVPSSAEATSTRPRSRRAARSPAGALHGSCPAQVFQAICEAFLAIYVSPRARGRA